MHKNLGSAIRGASLIFKMFHVKHFALFFMIILPRRFFPIKY